MAIWCQNLGAAPRTLLFLRPQGGHTHINEYPGTASKCLSPPPPPSDNGPWEARYQRGIGLLRSILKFEAPKPFMLLLIFPGHGNMVSKSRGCAPHAAFSSPPRAHTHINEYPGTASKWPPPPSPFKERPLGGQMPLGNRASEKHFEV